MEDDYAVFAAKYGLLAGAAVYALSILVKRWLNTKEDTSSVEARINVIDMLSARNRLLEEEIKEIQKGFDLERQLRLGAEEKAARLSIQVALLEAQLHPK